MSKTTPTLLALLLTLSAAACPDDATNPPGNSANCGAPDGTVINVSPDPGNDQANLQGAFVAAWPGATVCLAEGTYSFQLELTLEISGVTVKGQGKDKTILDFTNQDIGANGMLITGDQVTIEALAVKNTPGDGIRAQNVDDIVFRDMAVIWDSDADPENGAYGVYPVGCDTVLIEGCEVKGASDAGVYVGQSKNIIVRDNHVYGNVAGIEIENSNDAEVYNNNTHDNTAGILVFNLPGLPVKGGQRANVHDNMVENNNLPNFAPGGIVSNVPGGIGMLILACDGNEFHNNTIIGNDSTGIVIVHYIEALFGGFNDPEYNLYSSNNWIHSNTFANNGASPQQILAVITGEKPAADIIFDGCAETDDRHNGNCVSDNGEVRFSDLDFCITVDGVNQVITSDIAPVTCEGTKLPATTLALDPVAPAPAPDRPVGKDLLSEYGFFEGALAEQKPAAGTSAYAPASPLYSDYTAKHRFIWLPEGQKVTVQADGRWSFPDGAILIKTFAFADDTRDPNSPQKLIETRLMVKDPDGWRAESYLWNDAQTEATRNVGGKRIDVTYIEPSGQSVTTPYLVPNLGQCANCHAQSDAMSPLGVMTAQMNAPGQLAALESAGVFATSPGDPSQLPALVDPADVEAGSLDERARAYLHANCSHCHRSGGAADSSGLHLTFDETDSTRLGICKQPAAAGAGASGNTWDIVPGAPDESIMINRMNSTNPKVKMPELPNLRIHAEGLALIREWIAAMPAQSCGEAP